MANYYCILTGLPVLQLRDSHPVQGVKQLRQDLEGQLTKTDGKLMQCYFMRFDCENLVNVLEGGEAFDERGTMSSYEIAALIAAAREPGFDVPEYPAFMIENVRQYDVNQGKAGWFARDAVMLAYYRWAAKCGNSFMSEWYQLNINILNVLTALIARQQGWMLRDYVQGDDEVVQSILSNATQQDFGLGAQLDYMPELMRSAAMTDPVEKERMIDALRWNWLEERTFFEPFDINALFSYVVRTELLERWSRLDPQAGRERFTSIIEDLRGSARVPDEYVRPTVSKR